jgi:hypothetical protein
MAAFIVRKCTLYHLQGTYTTDAFLEELGRPVSRQIGKHWFFHVPLLDPNRCRYGIDRVDAAARNFMQTSFWEAMLVADIVMTALDNPETVERQREMTFLYGLSKDYAREQFALKQGDDPHKFNETEAICYLARELLAKFLTTDAGKAHRAELDRDYRVLIEMAEKEPLFIPW